MRHAAIYRLEPQARPGDPNWELGGRPREVVVRAFSAGDARLAAAESEVLEPGKDPKMIALQIRASAFLDPKLYSVRQISDKIYPADGPRGVLTGPSRSHTSKMGNAG